MTKQKGRYYLSRVIKLGGLPNLDYVATRLLDLFS